MRLVILHFFLKIYSLFPVPSNQQMSLPHKQGHFILDFGNEFTGFTDS